jgi:iron-sulfur cluster assembly protein
MSTLSTDRGIDVTPLAIEFGKKKLAEAEGDVMGIRVGVKGGGCNGFSYVFEFANKAREDRDRVLDFDGLNIIVDVKSLELLRGATLDWETKLVGYGFKWRNPNARDVCGCGDSFEVVR